MKTSRRGAVSLSLVVVALALSGCSGDGNGIPAVPTFGPTTSYPGMPNLPVNWTNQAGSFIPLHFRTSVEVYNTTSNTTIPMGSCLRPFVYRLDETNTTLLVSKNIPLHPREPGPLRAVYLNEATLSGTCTTFQAYGVNHGGTATPYCLRAVPEEEKNVPGQWRCDITVDYATSHGFLWENVTIVFGDKVVQSLSVNGQDMGSDLAGNLTFNQTAPGHPDIEFRAQLEVRNLGTWPYSAVRRS